MNSLAAAELKVDASHASVQLVHLLELYPGVI